MRWNVLALATAIILPAVIETGDVITRTNPKLSFMPRCDSDLPKRAPPAVYRARHQFLAEHNASRPNFPPRSKRDDQQGANYLRHSSPTARQAARSLPRRTTSNTRQSMGPRLHAISNASTNSAEPDSTQDDGIDADLSDFEVEA